MRVTRWIAEASADRRAASAQPRPRGAQGRRAGPEQRSGRAYRELFQFIKRADPADDTRRRTAGLDPVRIGLGLDQRPARRAASIADQGIPALQAWLQRALRNPVELGDAPDRRRAALISAALRELVDDVAAPRADDRRHRPAPRDVTPEGDAGGRRPR
jgi:hypothetical protein